MIKKIYIGADHRGYKLKKNLSSFMFEKDFKFEDMGADHYMPGDDYTRYAERVASMVADNKNSRGVLICGSGVGVDVMANKFDGVRASIGKTAKQVKAGRKDDNMNVLVIAADFTKEEDAKDMLKIFLETKFSGKERHKRRLSDIEKIEANN